MQIPYAKPSINDDDRNAVMDVMADRWLTQGPIIERFEAAVCEYTGAKYCVSVPNGTLAIYAICVLIPNNRLVIVPAICYVALPNMLTMTNARMIVPQDINLTSYNADKADFGVDLAGYYCEGPSLIDSAHSFNRNMPMIDCTRALSFHAVKNITTLGEGGAVITNNADVAKRIRAFGRQGNYESQGINWRMTCAQAAMGISQIKRADDFKARKQELCERYYIGMRDLDVILPLINEDVFWHLYIIRTEGRDKLQAYLAEQGIETRTHYKPFYKWPFYFGFKPLPNAEEYWRTALSLPLYADMTNAEQDYVIEHVKRGLE